MKIQVSWTFGQFTPTVEADVPEAALRAMAEAGALQVLQRTPASAVEKAIAGHTWEKGKKGGVIRPEKFERGSIEYSEENAEKVMAGFTGDFEVAEGLAVHFKCVDVSKHVPGEKGEGKMALAAQALISDDMLPVLRKNLGLASNATKEEVCKAFVAKQRGK